MAERLARLEAALSVVTGTDDLTKNSCAVVTSPIDATTVLQIPSPKMTPSMTDPIAYSHTTRLSTGSPNTIPASEDAPAEPVETEFAESFGSTTSPPEQQPKTSWDSNPGCLAL